MNSHPVRSRVLLVDDDPVSRIAMAGMCRRLEAHVEMAIDGLEAIEAVSKRRFDLVLLDLQLPGLDGYQTAQRLRMISPGIRIVAITATVLDDTARLCLDAGFEGVMQKPPSMDALAEHLGTGPGGGTSPGTESGPFDRVAFSRLLTELGTHLRTPVHEAVHGILRRLRDHMASTRSAFERGDFEATARGAHTMKAGAAWLGGVALARTMSEIEERSRAADVESAARALSTGESELAELEAFVTTALETDDGGGQR